MSKSLDKNRISSLCIRQILFVAIASFFAMLPSVHATPVSLRFDARITSVPPGSPFDLPLSFNVGDVIGGRFTIDSELGTSIGDNVTRSIQPFQFIFDINGTRITSSPFSLEVYNNTAFDDTDWGVIDLVLLRSLFAPNPQPPLLSLPSGESFRVGVSLFLLGENTILGDPTGPTSEIDLNMFTFQRTLNLNFDNEGPGSMGLQAEIGNFTIVPEPASILIVASTLIAVGVTRAHSTTQSHIQN